MSDYSFQIEIPSNFPRNSSKVLDTWQEHADELARELKAAVQNRSPVNTGTLSESAGYELPSGDGNPRDLIHVYFDQEVQLAGPWKRAYDVYQEGPPLGLSTYTNPPRQPVRRADPEDVPTITDWAYRYANKGAEDMVTNAVEGGYEVVQVL